MHTRRGLHFESERILADVWVCLLFAHPRLGSHSSQLPLGLPGVTPCIDESSCPLWSSHAPIIRVDSLFCAHALDWWTLFAITPRAARRHATYKWVIMPSTIDSCPVWLSRVKESCPLKTSHVPPFSHDHVFLPSPSLSPSVFQSPSWSLAFSRVSVCLLSHSLSLSDFPTSRT